MALLRTLMLAGTLNDRRLVWTHFEIYGMARGIVGLVVHRVVSCVLVPVFYRFSVGKNLPHRIGFRLKLAAMSQQRGTSRRANSGCNKAERGCSAQTPTDYEPHISSRVRVLVEARENWVLNQKLSTGEDGSQINNYWMMKNMLCNLAEDMLNNWSKARMAVHTMKSKIAEIDA